MSRHSKNASTRQFFTYEERRRLMGSGGLYGTKSARLGADSMLPFQACCLCMKPAVHPVLSTPLGYLYCKECILENIMQQKKRIARLRAEQEEQERTRWMHRQQQRQQQQQRKLQRFERWETGAVDGGADGSDDRNAVETGEPYAELKAAYRSHGPVFWTPGSMPNNTATQQSQTPPAEPSSSAPSPAPALTVVDPMDPERDPKKKRHALRMRDLVELHFSISDRPERKTEDDRAEGTSSSPSTTTSSSIGNDHSYDRCQCPLCMRTLSNSTKGVAMRRCGHVVCLACSNKFLVEKSKAKDAKKAKKTKDGDSKGGRLACPVCNESIKNPAKDMIWMKASGTGFATEDSISEARRTSGVAMTSFI